jgi:oligosaccharide repeat unit polymerase
LGSFQYSRKDGYSVVIQHSHVIRQKPAIATTFIFMSIVLLAVVFVTDISANSNIVRMYDYCFAWLGTLLYVWCLWSWYRLRGEWLCPYVVFLTVAFVFMFGQSMLMAIGVPIHRNDLHSRYASDIMLRADVFTVLALAGFHLGALLFALPKRSNSFEAERVLRSCSNSHLYEGTIMAGWILFAISVIPAFMLTFGRLRMAAQYGYMFLYDPSLVKTGLDTIASRVQGFFVPSLLCLFIGAVDKKGVRRLATTCIIAMTVFSFLTGGRSPGMVLAVTSLCIWHYTVKPIKGMRMLIVGIVGLLLVSFMPVVFKLRSVVGREFLDYVEVFVQSFGKDNLLVQATAEMGGSMFPLVNVMTLVPEVFPFRYGESYLYSLFTIIPNIGLWSVHPSAAKTNLGDWLQQVLGLGYGPGFSAAAEAYLNFGWAGIVFLFILGGFYGRVFSLIDYESDASRRDPTLLVFVFSVLSLTVMTNRNSFIGTVRAFGYYAIPVYVLCRMCAAYHRKKQTAPKVKCMIREQ